MKKIILFGLFMFLLIFTFTTMNVVKVKADDGFIIGEATTFNEVDPDIVAEETARKDADQAETIAREAADQAIKAAYEASISELKNEVKLLEQKTATSIMVLSIISGLSFVGLVVLFIIKR